MASLISINKSNQNFEKAIFEIYNLALNFEGGNQFKSRTVLEFELVHTFEQYT